MPHVSFDRQPPTWRPAGAAALLALASVVGCDGAESLARVPVEGSVASAGKPLAAGTVRFVPIDGTKGPTAVTKITDGFYTFTAEDGPVAGTYRVEIAPAPDFLGFDPGDQAAAERAMRDRGKRPKNPVPPGYGEKSPLRAEVTPAGTDDTTFLLTAARR
jgi:hypothetical protein